MITSAILIWLYLSIKSISIFLVVVTGTLLTVACLGKLYFLLMRYESSYPMSEREIENEGRSNKFFKLITKVFIGVSIVALLIPSTKDLQYIIGGAVAIEIVKSEEARKLPDNVLKSVNTFLEGFNENKEAAVSEVE